MTLAEEINDEYVVYGIRHLGSVDRFVYIGISKIKNGWTPIRTAEKRLRKHFGEALRETHYNKKLQETLLKHNLCFVVDVLSVLHNFDLKGARMQETIIISDFKDRKNTDLQNIIVDNNGWRPVFGNILSANVEIVTKNRMKKRGSGNRAISKRMKYAGV